MPHQADYQLGALQIAQNIWLIRSVSQLADRRAAQRKFVQLVDRQPAKRKVVQLVERQARRQAESCPTSGQTDAPQSGKLSN